MANTQDKQTQHPHVKHRLREGVLILCASFALYLLLAFVTYHHGDPGWSTTGNSDFVANSGGRFGALISDIFLSLFGYMAYLLPFVLIGFSWFLLRHRDEERQFSRALITLRVIGFFLMLFAGTGLLALAVPGIEHTGVPTYAGGILGDIVEPGMVGLFSVVGTALLLVALLLLGVTLLFGVSWVAVLKKIGLQSFQVLKGMHEKYQTRKAEKAKFASKFKPEKQAPSPGILKAKQVAPQTTSSPVPSPDKPASKIRKVRKGNKKVDLSSDSNTDIPPLSLLDEPQQQKHTGYTASQLEELSEQVEIKLREFGIDAEVMGAYPGPVVTRFELQLAPGMKVSKISSLSKDLARSLSKLSVRVVEVIPGKSYIGLEIPNEQRELVSLKDVLNVPDYLETNGALSIALGKDISGEPIVTDIAKMPHMLVAGTTGSGKSVSVNAMILSLLLKLSPDEARLIMIDPKMLELSVYEGIPHLLTPVVTDMKEAANALRWCVAEMDRRYRLMASLSVRNLAGFNAKVRAAIDEKDPIPDPLFPEGAEGEVPFLKPLPRIVVVIDELADMMMVVGKKVEELIARIAQKARAAGIHMILATQRPSVDVITGLIKANIPTRVAFQVSQRVDSRTILDQQGAEQLLGHGDMLFLPPGTSVPIRVHGPFVSDEEVHRVVAAWKKRGEPDYLEDVTKDDEEAGGDGILSGENAEADPLYDQAVQIVIDSGRASISLVQRRLRIGYNRAANLLEAMEAAGMVSSMGTNGQREVLVPRQPED